MTLRARVAAGAAASVLVVLAAVSVLLYLSYAASVRNQVDGSLVHAAEQASDLARSLKQQDVRDGASAKTLLTPAPVGSADLQILPGPVTVGEKSALGALTDTDIAVSKGVAAPYFANVTTADGELRSYTAALPGSPGTLVRTSRPVAADAGSLLRAAGLLTALTVVAAAAAFGIGLMAARRVLAPITDLTAAAEHVTQTRDLGARIRVTGTDEVARLGSSFDTMLAELESSVEEQQRLVADTSHELRTPLTSLTTNLDLLGEGAGVADPSAPDLVREARTEAAELARLVSGLVDLARYERPVASRPEVRLDLLAQNIVERARRHADQVSIVLDATPTVVRVDPEAAAHAVSNLVDNALKWSPTDGTIAVVVRDRTLSVSDEGPGIEAADVPQIFKRFYRADSARGMPGSGLGLAIVAHAMAANNGSATVSHPSDPTTFTLHFANPDDVAAVSERRVSRSGADGKWSRTGPTRTPAAAHSANRNSEAANVPRHDPGEA